MKPVNLVEKSEVVDKRKHPRVMVDLPFKYSKNHIPTKHGQAVNASEGGLLVHLPEEVEVGRHLTLQLFFPPRSALDTLEASVEVIWSRLHLRKDWGWDYRTGVRFLDMGLDDMTQFKNYLEGLSQGPSGRYSAG